MGKRKYESMKEAWEDYSQDCELPDIKNVSQKELSMMIHTAFMCGGIASLNVADSPGKSAEDVAKDCLSGLLGNLSDYLKKK